MDLKIAVLLFLSILPLPNHIRHHNVAIVILVLTLFLLDLSSGINTILWANTVVVKDAVWCDIVTRFDMGAQWTLSASSICIGRHLARVADVHRGPPSLSEKRRRVVFEIVMCVVAPCIVMVLYYIVQGHRFDLIEDLGCYPVFYFSIPYLVLIGIPQLLLPFISVGYIVTAVVRYFKNRTRFPRCSNGGTRSVPLQYYRLMAWAIVEVVGQIGFGMFFSICNAFDEPLRPWISWANVKWHFSAVGQFPTALLPARAFTILQMSDVVAIIGSFAFFLFFGLSEESVADYRRAIRWFRRKILRSNIPSTLPDPLVQNALKRPNRRVPSWEEKCQITSDPLASGALSERSSIVSSVTLASVEHEALQNAERGLPRPPMALIRRQSDPRTLNQDLLSRHCITPNLRSLTLDRVVDRPAESAGAPSGSLNSQSIHKTPRSQNCADTMIKEAGSLEVFLPGDITFKSTKPVESGGYGDLFKGEHPTKGTLALKRLRRRIGEGDDPNVKKSVQNAYIAEVAIWRRLHHPHVLVCFGLLHNSWDEIYLVSPWEANGSLTDFVAGHPEADRTQLLHDAADGLAYLHQNDIIHGDIKGLNALVTTDRRVALCDFGLSKLATTTNVSTGTRGTPRWQSPELLDSGPRSKEADVYAFGIMIYEILSGKVPFEGLKDSAVVVAVLIRNERPPKEPQHSSQGESYTEHWQIAEGCWSKTVAERPAMAEVVVRWPSSALAQDQGLIKLAKGLFARYQEHHRAADLDETIRLYRDIVAFHPPGHPQRADSLQEISLYLSERYTAARRVSDLDEAIIFQQEVTQLRSTKDHHRAKSLYNLARYIRRRFNVNGNALDLDQAITLQQEVIQIQVPWRAKSLRALADDLLIRYKLALNASDLDQAISFEREVLQLRAPGDPERVSSLETLASDLDKRYSLTDSAADLAEAITLQRETVQLRPAENSCRAFSLHQLAFYLYKDYTLTYNAKALEEAVKFQQEVVQLRATGDPDRLIALRRLAFYLDSRCSLTPNTSDLDEAITIARDALDLCLPGDPERISSLRHIGIYFHRRYSIARNVSDLDEAISFKREALQLLAQDHPRRLEFLRDLESNLAEESTLGPDLNRAIALKREMLQFNTSGDSQRAGSLHDFGFYLNNRYILEHNASDLDEAIIVQREAMQLRSQGNPQQRASSLNNLGIFLHNRYTLTHHASDLDEAITLVRAAVRLYPVRDTLCAVSLHNLGGYLYNRHVQALDPSDLDESISLLREALPLWPPENSQRALSLHDFGLYLNRRYTLTRKPSDLEEVIRAYTELSRTYRPGHPSYALANEQLAKLLQLQRAHGVSGHR